MIDIDPNRCSVCGQPLPGEYEPEFNFDKPIGKLSKDVRQAAQSLSRTDAGWIVDQFYNFQEDRKRAGLRHRKLVKTGEPQELVQWTFETSRNFELAMKHALGEFASTYRVGRWLRSIYGIDKVLSAYLLVKLDIRKAKRSSHFLRFAGLDPSLSWLGKVKSKKLVDRVIDKEEPFGELTPDKAEIIFEETGQHALKALEVWEEYRLGSTVTNGKEALTKWLSRMPWNGKLKAKVLFGMGEVMVKFSNRPECYYGQLFKRKKAELKKKNERGLFREVANKKMADGLVAKTTETWKHWEAGHLSPGHIHNRARRWTMSLLISHLHEVMFMDYHGEKAPLPYIFEAPGDLSHDHRHYIPPPKFDQATRDSLGGRCLTEMRD